MVNFTRIPSLWPAGMMAGCLLIAAGCSSSRSTAGVGGVGGNASGSAGGAQQGGGAQQNAGASGTAPNAFVTTVSGSLKLTELTTPGAQQLCRDAHAYIRSQITPQQSMVIGCELAIFTPADKE